MAEFLAPMNLPGEETLKVNVPVTVLTALGMGGQNFSLSALRGYIAKDFYIQKIDGNNVMFGTPVVP